MTDFLTKTVDGGGLLPLLGIAGLTQLTILAQSTVLLGIAGLTQLTILTQSTVLTSEPYMAIPINLTKQYYLLI